MGGPVVTVALHKPLSDTQIDELDAWLRSVGTVSNAARYPNREWLGQIATWDLNLTDRAAIGMDSIRAEEYIGIYTVTVSVAGTRDASGRLYEQDEDDVAQWITQVGFFPDQEIWLSSMGKSFINHRVLGQTALTLAERYDGIIDLQGAWYPPIDLDWLPEHDPANGWTKTGKTPFVYQGPGKMYEIRYATARGTHWYYNLADFEAFRASLQREYFHLIS